MVKPIREEVVTEGVLLGGKTLANVSEFKYVGSKVNCEGNLKHEIEKKGNSYVGGLL